MYGLSWMWTCFIFFLAATMSSALYENCNYYQNMQVDQTYYVFSPGYPNKYQPGSSCRFYAVSPPGTQIHLVCQSFSIPPSQDCMYDRLSISKSGLLDLTDAVNYCGSGEVQVRSSENKMNIVLFSSQFSPGGSFLCSIMALPAQSNTCECGWKNQERVVGGMETGVNEYPMMSGLVDGTLRELFCGATIISNKFAVTAAHCLVQKKPYNTALLVGDHDTSLGNETDSANLLLIDKFIIHSDYDSASHINDIALVRVQNSINFNLKVGPACLPVLQQRDSFVGEKVVVLGWGALRYGGITSKKLMGVKLGIVSNGDCQMFYGDKLIKDQICTYGDNKDACQNDSGGPLLWKDHNGRLKLLGIISYGIQCATSYPGVNTRVTSYVDWIRSNTGLSIYERIGPSNMFKFKLLISFQRKKMDVARVFSSNVQSKWSPNDLYCISIEVILSA